MIYGNRFYEINNLKCLELYWTYYFLLYTYYYYIIILII